MHPEVLISFSLAIRPDYSMRKLMPCSRTRHTAHMGFELTTLGSWVRSSTAELRVSLREQDSLRPLVSFSINLRPLKWVTLWWFLWCASLSTDTRFCFLYFRMNNCQAHMMLHQEKELPNDSERPLSYNIFTDKNKMAAIMKQCLFAFSVLNWVFTMFTYGHSKSGVYKWL